MEGNVLKMTQGFPVFAQEDTALHTVKVTELFYCVKQLWTIY